VTYDALTLCYKLISFLHWSLIRTRIRSFDLYWHL